MDNGLKKDRECIQCGRFFECEGKPDNVERCIYFKKRRWGNESERVFAENSFPG